MRSPHGNAPRGYSEAGLMENSFAGGGPVETQARIVSMNIEQGGVHTTLLYAPEIALRAVPMQFVQVKVAPLNDPFLRRPFGLSRISPEEGIIGITWATVGRGTSLMGLWREGDTVSVLGPLGNGLRTDRVLRTNPGPHGRRPVWLVAGGTGLAPLYPLALSLGPHCRDITVLYGARTAEALMDTSLFETVGCKVTVATEDGSAGVKGRVTGSLGHLLASFNGPLSSNPPLAVACGPTPMLRAVKAMLRDTPVELYVSLEERMACGTGLCKGCAVKAAPPRSGYFHVCSDGPVFPAGEVLLGGEGQGA